MFYLKLTERGALCALTLATVLISLIYAIVIKPGSVFLVWGFSFLSIWPIVWKVFNRSLSLSLVGSHYRRILGIRSTADTLQIVIWLWLVLPTLLSFREGSLNLGVVLVVTMSVVHLFLVVKSSMEFVMLIVWLRGKDDWLT